MPKLTVREYALARRRRQRLRSKNIPGSGVCFNIQKSFIGCFNRDIGCGTSTANTTDERIDVDNHDVPVHGGPHEKDCPRKKPQNLILLVHDADLEEMKEVYHLKLAAVGDDEEKSKSLQNELNCTLLQAVITKKPKLVELLLDLGADAMTSTAPFHQYPAARFAVQLGCEEIIDMFISKGVKFITEEDKGNNILHATVIYGNQNILKKLLGLGEVDVNARDKTGNTALHIAVQQRRADCVNLLIEEAADVNAEASSSRTALHMAAMAGQDGIITRLIQNGAKVDTRDCSDKLPWIYALEYGHMSAVEILEREMSKVGLDIANHQTNIGGKSFLCQAVESRSTFAVEYLVKKGYDLCWKDTDGKTLLMIAILAPPLPAMLETLLSYKECANGINDTDMYDETVLMHLLRKGLGGQQEHVLASMLVKAGADINACDSSEGVPIIFRHLFNDVERKFLLGKGANLNFLGPDGDSLLHQAALRTEILLDLLEYNIDIGLSHHEGPDGQTPFVKALPNNSDNAKLLFYSGCSLNGFNQFMKSEAGQQLIADQADMSHFIEEVRSAEHAHGPLSLWDQSRQSVLRTLGHRNSLVLKDKVAHLGLPVTVAKLLEPQNYKDYISQAS